MANIASSLVAPRLSLKLVWYLMQAILKGGSKLTDTAVVPIAIDEGDIGSVFEEEPGISQKTAGEIASTEGSQWFLLIKIPIFMSNLNEYAYYFC